MSCRTGAHRRGMLRMGLVLLMAGCASAGPRAGLAAKQQPAGGSPPAAWREVQGRLLLSVAWQRISCRLIVDRDGQGRMHLVALADEGPVLFDVACDRAGVVRHAAQDGMAPAAEMVARLAWQAWGVQESQSGHWDDGRWLTKDAEMVRTFGGDPLLLRAVGGSGPDLEIGDYRSWHSGLLAFQAVATDIGLAVRIELQDPRMQATHH